MTREEASSPTVSLEGLLTTLAIDAFEERDVAIFDVLDAYLNADMPSDKIVLIKFEGKFADIMCEMNNVFKQDIQIEGNKKVLYMRIVKALYGCTRKCQRCNKHN